MCSVKEKIKELYERYLKVTMKNEKIEAVRKLQQQLTEAGIVTEWDEQQYIVKTATAYVTSAKLSDDIDSMLKEMNEYLEASLYYIVVTTKEREAEYSETRLAEKAKELGLNVRWYGDYQEAFAEIARNDLAIAYVVFRKK